MANWIVTQDYIKGEAHVVSNFKGYPERSESLRCAKMGQEFAQGIADAFEKENALKLIDSLETINGALRRSIILSDAIMSIGKET